jgi:hypothetical protein
VRRMGAQRITTFVVFDLCATAGAVIGGHLNGRHGVQLLLLAAAPSFGMGIAAAALALLTQAKRSRRAQPEDV